MRAVVADEGCIMTRLRIVLAAVLLLFAIPAHAAVTLTFYSHAFGSSFPHAFVTLRGVPDSGGEAVDGAYGFTAVAVTPALLMGSVRGMIEHSGPAYVRNSNAHFSLLLSDAEYARVLGVIRRWRDAPQNSYNLDTANCIHFVADVARTLGFESDVSVQLRRRPGAFLDWLMQRNAAIIARHRLPGAAVSVAR
jgi:hypothetical protein